VLLLKSFDLTEKSTVIILVAILFFYIAFSFNELFIDECTGLGDCFDYDRRMARISVWDIDWIADDFRHFVHLSLLVFSKELFGNPKVLVLASSAILLLLTYLVTFNLTGKRIAGITALLVVLSSSIFRTYDTSVTYPSFWATLFLFSMYLFTTRFWAGSSLTYLTTIPAKAVTAFFFPAFIGFILLSDCQTKKTKVKLLAIFLFLIVVGLVFVFLIDDRTAFPFFTLDYFTPMNFLSGFVSWMWKGFAGDQITLLLLFASGFIVFSNRKVIRNSNAVLVLLAGIVLTSPFLISLTTYDVWPYRELPLVIVIGILTGMLVGFYDKINWKAFSLNKRTKGSASNQEEHPHYKQ